jgi:hypothetical protein
MISERFFHAAIKLLTAVEQRPSGSSSASIRLAREAARQLGIEKAANELSSAMQAMDDELSARIQDENTAELLERIAEYRAARQ